MQQVLHKPASLSLSLPSLPLPPSLYPRVQLTDVAFAMMELIEANKLTEAERNQKIIRIIFAGMMEMMLNSVEDSRRSWSPLFVPKFSAFVKYLSAGSGEARRKEGREKREGRGERGVTVSEVVDTGVRWWSDFQTTRVNRYTMPL